MMFFSSTRRRIRNTIRDTQNSWRAAEAQSAQVPAAPHHEPGRHQILKDSVDAGQLAELIGAYLRRLVTCSAKPVSAPQRSSDCRLSDAGAIHLDSLIPSSHRAVTAAVAEDRKAELAGE